MSLFYIGFSSRPNGGYAEMLCEAESKKSLELFFQAMGVKTKYMITPARVDTPETAAEFLKTLPPER